MTISPPAAMPGTVDGMDSAGAGPGAEEGEQSRSNIEAPSDGSFLVTCLGGSVGIIPLGGGKGVFIRYYGATATRCRNIHKISVCWWLRRA